MFYYVIVFFVIVLIVVLFGFIGIVVGVVSIVKILFVVFLVLFVLLLIFGGLCCGLCVQLVVLGNDEKGVFGCFFCCDVWCGLWFVGFLCVDVG